MAYDWSRQELARSPWRGEVVPRVPSMLIQRPKIGRPITYEELAAELKRLYGLESKARKTLYGPAVGAVGFAIQELDEQWGEKIPPLNPIVQADTRLPGYGANEVAHYYFGDGGAGMDVNRKDYIMAAMDAVFDYGQKWDRVAHALGMDVPEAAHATADEGSSIELPTIPAAYRPESAVHKQLRNL